MELSEQELRAMVRDAIARHARQAGAPAPPTFDRSAAHASHGKLSLVSGGDAEGQCLIEPAVRCNQCGYCQSLGH